MTGKVTPALKRCAGFTLVELLIGMSLSLMIMAAVLSSYVYLGRNFTRGLGLSSANQPTLESQGRRTLAYFAQDVRMANGLTVPVSPDTLANEVTLNLPTGSGTKAVTYYYNSSASNVAKTISGYAITVAPQSLTRVDGNTGVTQTLHTKLLTCVFTCYDASGNPYASPYTDYMIGLKQVAVTFTAQTGSNTNGTLTQIYTCASPRLLIRNKSLLP